MEPIEYDQSEFIYHTDVTYVTLDFICDMYGPTVRDKLLVPKVVEDVRISDRRNVNII